MAEMATARCELCGREEKTLLRVNHKEHGRIKSAIIVSKERLRTTSPQAVAAVIKG